MKPPKYRLPDAGEVGTGGICSLCGALVLDRDAHTSWHAALARILGLEDDE